MIDDRYKIDEQINKNTEKKRGNMKGEKIETHRQLF